jgi:hypothetical protein
MNDDVKPDPLAAHARELAEQLRSLDETIESTRRFLASAPVLPLPGQPGQVGPSPAGASVAALASAREATRTLRAAERRRDQLRREQRDIDLGRETASEARERAALAWLNAVEEPEELLARLVSDPDLPGEERSIIEASPGAKSAALRLARGILRLRARQAESQLNRLDDLLAVPGVDSTFLDDLRRGGAQIAARSREAEAARAAQEVGVLLPIRIETRFDPGKLRLRVIPDHPWFARHDQRTSAGELVALERYVAAIKQATPEASRLAWQELAGGGVGGARAVWLVRNFVVLDATGQSKVERPPADELRTEPAFQRIVGFPAELHVWLTRRGAAPTRIATMQVDQTRLSMEPPDRAAGEHRWWEDWEEAVRAGLGIEIPFTENLNDVETLYVIGLGAGDPAALFADHRDAGQLGLLAPGTPTNTIDGAPAATLATDPDSWLAVLQSPANDTERSVSLALTGDSALLGNLPGPSEPHRSWNAAAVAGLWPALWGFAGDDVWAIAWPGTSDAAAWAPHALFPEGPYPILRIGSLPYGLLPATSLVRWQTAAGEPTVETGLQPRLLKLVDLWRASAETRGTVDGATTEKLLDLLAAVPTAPGYRHRRAWPIELWWLLAREIGGTIPWDAFDRAWHGRYGLADQLGLTPIRRYGTNSAPRRLAIPLIRPEGLPADRPVAEPLRALVKLAFTQPSLFARPDVIEQEIIRVPLDSLLLRLALRSLQVALGDIVRSQGDAWFADPEELAYPDRAPGRLEARLARLTPDLVRADTPATRALRRVTDGLAALGNVPEHRLDRLLRATVDTAVYRIDPWIVGLPARRLQDLLDSGQARLRLGAYGWVDTPKPGAPGPTRAGLLHAPSQPQVVAAMVLRDRAVNDSEPARWHMDLTSRSIRDADHIAEHVRSGAHLAEALGREVERIVGVPAIVTRLRREYPLRTEHAGRRTCDGLAVLGVLAADPVALNLNAAALQGLTRLRTALDAYGDLLVAEGVYHLAQGRAEAAGAAMDAAAGRTRPPRLDLLRTPREGHSVATSVVVLLPHVAELAVPADPLEHAEISPSALADAAAVAFLATQVGAAADWQWTVVSRADPNVQRSVKLADLLLTPADALSLPLADLERLVIEAGAEAMGLSDVTTAGLSERGGSERYERAARLTALLGRAPATADAVNEAPDAGDGPAMVETDLRARYLRLRTTATHLVEQIEAQLVQTTADGALGTADPAILRRVIAAARRWGIAPDPPAASATGAAAPDRLVILARRAKELLAARLEAAPSAASSLGRDDLLAALTDLVSPTGQLAVLSRLRRDTLPGQMQRAGTSGAVWLTIVAAVREPLARLEMHQLSAPTPANTGPALVGWSNKPDDPWQQDTMNRRRLVIAYTAEGLDLATLPASGTLAVGLLDRFTEFVPATDQTTGVAFGFNAPAARAPQAILLAVPPNPGGALDPETLRDIVSETRTLAHARMARPAELDVAVRGLLPTALLPATGRTAVRLDPTGP